MSFASMEIRDFKIFQQSALGGGSAGSWPGLLAGLGRGSSLGVISIDFCF
jgi:hypothetical protein